MMNKKTKEKPFNKFISIFLFYALIFTFIIPTQTFSETIPTNKSINQGSTVNKTNDNPKVDRSFGNVPVYFEQNNGQFDKRVRYFARGTSGYSLFLTSTEAVYVLSEKKEVTGDRRQVTGRSDIDSIENPKSKTQNSKATAVFMKLAGANQNSSSVGIEEMSHKTNYFKGKKENWRTEIPNFRQIRMNNLYQGIDAVWKGKENGAVQYDFVVKPNANANQIEWEIAGAKDVEIDEKGNLLIKTEYGTIRQQKPFTYQENKTNGLRQEVNSRFKIKENPQSVRIGFELGNYDRSKTLTIDPSVDLSQLSFSTFLGGADLDYGNGITVDRVGNVYVTGTTESFLFPTTFGTFDTSINGSGDVFVTKLNASGSALIYSTFIGGSGADVGDGIALDSKGNVYIAGYTNDDTIDYPTTSGAFDETHNGAYDVFVTKISPDGSSLIFSTLIGGSGAERRPALIGEVKQGIAVDALENVFITGITEDDTTDYPTTSGAFDETHNGDFDVFVTKLNSGGSGLIYSTFLGGSGYEEGRGIAVDSAGNAFVTGATNDDTTDLPTTSGAFDETHNGVTDAFVSKFNATGSALVYSTFLGGSGIDDGRGITVDSAGNAFVTGGTADDTTDLPTTTGAFSVTHNGGGDAFVSKFNADGSALVYSTFLGGSEGDFGSGITMDSEGNTVVTGTTVNGSTNLPTTTGAFDESHNGELDAFVSKFNADGSALVYSTFLGGSAGDIGLGITLDSVGNAFVTGLTADAINDLPTTSGAFDETNNGNLDAFVTKFGDFSISGRTVDTSGNALVNTAVALSGDGTGFMLSDTDGYFYFGDTLPPFSQSGPGNYLVSATQTLYNFNPSNFQVSVNRNKQITFVGRPTSSGPTAAYASFGGNVRSTVGNVGLANTKLTLIDAASGNTTQVVSDSNGNYEFEGLLTGVYYLVVPQKDGYNFNPGIYEVNHLQESLSNDFLATPNSPRPVNDFDGDGKTDLAVFRPSEGNWYILESQSNNVRILRFGLDGDIPVASDFDGDNKTDIAVYRPTDGNWYRINSSNGEFSAIHFGIEEDKPVQADFDGDGKTDLAVYRPSTGVWHRLMSSDGSYSSIKFGIETDIPIAADYDSDGKADLTVFRDGTWYHQMSRDNSVSIYQFGLAGDKPIRGDFDGDGRIDTSLYRPQTGVWYWIESSDQDIQAKQFGISTDIPTPSDYNGDGRYEQSVFREGIWYISNADNSFYTNQFGKDGDVPIP